MIFEAALPRPGFNYFQFTTRQLEEKHAFAIYAHKAGTLSEWKTIAKVSPKPNTSRQNGFNPVEDLAVFNFMPRPWNNSGWATPVRLSVPRQVYELNFVGLRRVGLTYRSFHFRCPEEGHALPNNPMPDVQHPGPQWPMRHSPQTRAKKCLGPCYVSVMVFPRWFQDANVLYLLVRANGGDLVKEFRNHLRLYFPHLSQAKALPIFLRELKSSIPEVEVCRDAKTSGSRPWDVCHILRREHARLLRVGTEGLNPNMQFKVLVTTTAMTTDAE
ncbi:unnamed protein product [Parascedosporium putredinis]|uniref:Uncharacterized protein n=1 Tax=Parascedosporium putredinis TaxID=1442378 RepID=A0A9P1H3Y0_9PEZI|nr:unnamed protein product [Parascedosporium putredinis]CAI7996201.1 unnamed protein product [Parascedosporium putredinis]